MRTVVLPVLVLCRRLWELKAISKPIRTSCLRYLLKKIWIWIPQSLTLRNKVTAVPWTTPEPFPRSSLAFMLSAIIRLEAAPNQSFSENYMILFFQWKMCLCACHRMKACTSLTLQLQRQRKFLRSPKTVHRILLNPQSLVLALRSVK